jgi:hypothetical protein
VVFVVFLMLVMLALVGLAVVIVIDRRGGIDTRFGVIMGMVAIVVAAGSIVVVVMVNRYAAREKKSDYCEGRN